jgi:adenylate cyclase
MSVDWEAEGLLEGVDDPAARDARVALLEELHDDGVELDELRRAVQEDRLALIPVERILLPDGDRYTAEEMAERTNTDLEFLRSLRQALGLPRPQDDEPVYTSEDLRAIELQRQLDEVGFDADQRLEVARVLGQSMAQVAEVVRDVTARALSKPGDTERDRGLRYAEAARSAAPLLGPLLEQILTLHLREQVLQDVLSATDLATGGVSGATTVGVAFADIVGFTRLGEEIPSEELGAVAGRLADLASDIAKPPVRLVKLIGDAAMLVAPREPQAVLDAALELVAAAEREGGDFPQLRAGAAAGEAVGRGGDWYGSPVNVASRVTQIARPQSVLATKAMRQAVSDENAYRWSSAGRRSLRGVRGETTLFRVRRAERDGGDRDADD